MPKISQLFIYPLKSAQGISQDTMTIDSAGPCHDREWMLISKNNSFVSQRTHPRLGLFKTSLTSTHLGVEAPGGERIEVQLDDWGQRSHATEAKIFGKNVAVNFYPDLFNSFFSDHLNDDLRLVRTPAEKPRTTSGKHGPVSPVNFSDGYPFLLTSEASLGELNEKLSESVGMKRFRPNIVISGSRPGEEDNWKQFQISSVDFVASKACARCSIINIKPGTIETDKQVTQALKTYRQQENGIFFGQNLTHLNQGHIHIGDSLEKIVKKEY